jgi:hypothetical protein
MKKSDLKEYIKTRIRETLTIKVGASKLTPQQKSAKINALKSRTGDQTIGTETNPVDFIPEIELDEMARPATVLTVAPNYRELASTIKTGGPLSPTKLKDVLNFLADKEQITGPEIAAGVGYPGKMPRIYPIYAALLDKGALIPTEKEKTVEIPETPENEDVEDILDVPAEVEPTEPDEASLEKAKISTSTDAQKAAMFTVDNADLISKIIRVYKDSRVRIGEILREEEDLSPEDYKKAVKQSKETSLDRLSELLNELIDKLVELEPSVQDKVLKTLDFKFNSVNANQLSKIIFDRLGQEFETPAEEEEFEFEDFDDENINEDVDDVDYGSDDFKAYDSVY